MTAARAAALLIAALLALPGIAGAAEVVDRIIAVVNSDLILHSDLEEAVQSAARTQLQGVKGAQRDQAMVEMREQALEFLIDDKLMTQAMDRADIRVEDSELEAWVGDVLRSNKLTLEDLERELGRAGMTLEDYRSQARTQVRRYKFMNLMIRGRIEITDEDVRAYYQRTKATASPDPAWQLQRLLVAWDKGADTTVKAEVSARAATLRNKIDAGEQSFADAAREFSADKSSAERGGDVGTVKPSDLSDAWAGALRAAPVGKVVQLEGPTGIWLLRVAEEIDTAVKPFEEVREQIARVLYEESQERELKKWAEEERKRAHLRVIEE